MARTVGIARHIRSPTAGRASPATREAIVSKVATDTSDRQEADMNVETHRDLEVVDVMARAIRDVAKSYNVPQPNFDLARDQALAAWRAAKNHLHPART